MNTNEHDTEVRREKVARVCISLARETLEEAKQEAKDLHMTFSAYVRAVLEEARRNG